MKRIKPRKFSRWLNAGIRTHRAKPRRTRLTGNDKTARAQSHAGPLRVRHLADKAGDGQGRGRLPPLPLKPNAPRPLGTF